VPIVAAQDATPSAGTCTGPAVDTEHVLSVWYDAEHNLKGTPEAPGMQAPTGPEVTLPIGKPADAMTTAGVTQTVTAVFACFAAGDFPTALGYFTDKLTASFGPEMGVTYEQAQEFLSATPTPDPSQNALVSVSNVMTLDDGRAGAFVIERLASGDDIGSYAIFVKDGDLWKVDEIFDFPSVDDTSG